MREKEIFKITPFTKEMKKTYKIIGPQMLPIHFDLLELVFNQAGYNAEILKTDNKNIVEEGVKSVHNDACYPALLVIGQFIDALKSGKYDVEKTAIIITQTGGGCRASNYVVLLQRALEKNGFKNIPILSLNFSGFDNNPGFKINIRSLIKMVYCVLYGDFLTSLYNQCLPYEVNTGESKKVVEKWEAKLAQQMKTPEFTNLKKNYKAILEDFAKVKRDTSIEKVKVGIVGEIYLKYAPLGNNKLEEYLVKEGAEVVNSGLLDFCMYCAYNGVFDKQLYNMGSCKKYFGSKIAAKFMVSKQRQMIKAIKDHGVFRPMADFGDTVEMARGYIGHGVKMGEGWLLTADMLELIHTGVNNIITVQPFGCLPNHIVAKGMIRKIKDNHPESNIVAIDYDPGASKINQENRIGLMLANARLALKNKETGIVEDEITQIEDLTAVNVTN